MRSGLFFFPAILFCLNCFAQEDSIRYRIYFETGSSYISSAAAGELKKCMQPSGDAFVNSVWIRGYCDDVGEAQANNGLSLERARAVEKLIRSWKLPKAEFREVSGLGEMALEPGTDQETQRRENRSVLVTWTAGMEQMRADPFKGAKVGSSITLSNLLFIPGRHALLPESHEAMKELLKFMKDNPDHHILVKGHICCAEPGKDGLDDDTGLINLSEARARMIYDYLVLRGIDARRIRYVGMKADYPTGKGDKEDRRVEIEITKIESLK